MPCKFSCCNKGSVHHKVHWIEQIQEEVYHQDQSQDFLPNTYQGTKTLVLSTALIAQQVNKHESNRLLRVLFDSGGSATLFHEDALPRGCKPTSLEHTIRSNTVEGTFESKSIVLMENIILPEFDCNKKLISNKHWQLRFIIVRVIAFCDRRVMKKTFNGIKRNDRLREDDQLVTKVVANVDDFYQRIYFDRKLRAIPVKGVFI